MSYRDGEDIDVIFLTESGTAASRKVSQLSLHKWFGRGSFCTDTSCFCKFRGISPPLSASFMDFMAKSQRIWGLNWGFWFYMLNCKINGTVHIFVLKKSYLSPRCPKLHHIYVCLLTKSACGFCCLALKKAGHRGKILLSKGQQGCRPLFMHLLVNYTMVIIGWLSFVPIGDNSKAVFLSKQIICDNSGVGLFAVNI